MSGPVPPASRRESRRRRWSLDLGGWLFSLLGPLAVTWAAVEALRLAFPGKAASVAVPPPLAFALSFVVIDYAAYWIHRALHRGALWPFHFTHHTVERFNGVAAGRRALAEALLSPILAIHGVAFFFLADRSWYGLGMSTTFFLEIWRHSPLTTSDAHFPARVLRSLIVTPEYHAIHHRASSVANFAMNIQIWDKVHGTYESPGRESPAMGEPTSDGVLRLLMWSARLPGQPAIGKAE